MPRATVMRHVAAGLHRPVVFAAPRTQLATPLATRYYSAGHGRNKLRGMQRKVLDQIGHGVKDTRLSEGQKSATEFFRGGNGPLYPATFVSLPLSQYPRSPRDFSKYTWYRLRSWAMSMLSLTRTKLSSMDGWGSRPKYKAQRRKIPPTAKAMYREMLEAFAAGDKSALRRLCQPTFATKLIGAIDRRSPREQTKFELVRYNRPAAFPRLSSYQIFPSLGGDPNMLDEQAVVAIASTQQTHKCDAATGRTIDGSFKVQDKVEYVVLTREVHAKIFERSPWRIWGTTTATTLAEHVAANKRVHDATVKALNM